MSQSNLQEVSNLISSVTNQALVRPYGDPYTIGISGFIFDIMDEIDVQIDSDITDHYVEQNYAIQDHIALKPVIVTLKGYAAELVSNVLPQFLNQIFTQVSGLVPLTGLAPAFNVQDQEFYNELNSVAQLGENVVNNSINIFQNFSQGATLATKQQNAFQFLFNMWQTRQLCIVETPWNVFEGMAVQSIRPVQTGETTKISEFVVTFKQILTVAAVQGIANVNSTTSQNLGSVSNLPPITGGSLEATAAPTVNLGTDNGQANDSNGSPYTVASVSKNIYTQQLPNPTFA